MIILVDESVESSIVRRLRQDGYLVEFVSESSPGIPDERVLARGVETGALVLTEDKDFGDLVFREHQPSAGVVLIRLSGLTPDHKASVVSTVIRQHDDRLLNAFTVVGRVSVRIRHRSG